MQSMASPDRQKSRFRLDILGVRGMAILLVLAAHFQVPGFSGGFIGVDLFFVVSGYLIVGLMYQEFVKNGKSLGGYGWISVSSFYQRRVRRILPAAFATLLAVYVATFFLNDPNIKLQTTRDILWSLLFASNIHFTHRQTDYFSRGDLPSPVLHFWSLAVEEQFYVLMPFIFMSIVNWHGFSLGGKRLAARMRLYVFLSLISVVSATTLVILFEKNPTQAYFSLFSRVWEFGIGALAAITMPVLSLSSKIVLYSLRPICISALVLGFFTVTQKNFGYMLFLPTISIGILLFINNQLRSGFFYKHILTNRFLTFFGKISFSLYLLHWPVLIFAEYFGFSPSWPHKILLFFCLISISAFAERYIERPFLRIGHMSEFHVSPLLKSRRITAGILLFVTAGLFVATYQPVISNQLVSIQTKRDAPFWSPPAGTNLSVPQAQVEPAQPSPGTTSKQQTQTRYLGIFGDSTNQCCSTTGAFWPRLLAQHYNWQFIDFSKPATSYEYPGVGSNGCNQAHDCPSVGGQMALATNREFSVITIASGIGDCDLANSNPNKLQDDMNTIYGNFRKQFPNAVILAPGVIYPRISSRNQCIDAVDPIIAKAAQSVGGTYIDNVSDWIDNPKIEMTLDGGHLNDLGHQIFSSKLIDWLTSRKVLSHLN